MRKSRLNLAFVVFLAISLIFFLLFKTGLLNLASTFTQRVFAPVQVKTRGLFIGFLPQFGSSQLQKENLELSAKLIDQKMLAEDNKALRDQFQTASPKSSNLLPARIIASSGLIPVVSFPESFILDKGWKDGVKKGQAVVYKDNLIGVIRDVAEVASRVSLVSSTNFSFSAATVQTGALGIIKGEGSGQMILDNVLQKDVVKPKDLIISKGDINIDGFGIPPDLIIGKVTSVNKNPSSLFQSAKVVPIVNMLDLFDVFIIKQI